MVISFVCVLAEAVAGSDIGFDTNDRFDASLFGFFIKLDRAIERAVVGESNSIHAELFRAVYKIIDFRETV